MLAKPSKTCLDSWAALGNPGWDWDGLLPYYRKFMSLNRPPPKSEKLLDTSRMQEWIGDGDGPIQASWPPAEYTTAVQQMAPEWAKNLGLRSHHAAIGDSTGYYDQALSIDMEAGRRSSAVYEYYQPNAHRTNLFLITDAMVQRIVFSDDDSNGEKVATGVEFVVHGCQYSASAKREVILCAGTIQSPQILELSGIGSRSILEKHDIKVLVDNPGVGENLQDHVMSGMAYEAVSGLPTREDLKQPGVMDMLIGEYLKNPVGPLVNHMTSSIYMSYGDILDDKSKLKQNVESLVPNSQTLGNTGLAKQMKIHQERLLNPADCAVWLIPFSGGIDLRNVSHGSGIFNHSDPEHYLSFAAALTHPLSRGSSHIQSSDACVHPIIDPRYMSHPADIHVLAQALRVIDAKLVHTEPFASKLKGCKQPTCQSFSPDTAEGFAQEYLSTQWHVLGTCSMLPREDGGVVNPTLEVYGTANLRVIDASIIPLEVQGNIQTAVYAVAEKGADLVKATW
jgi:choline dehydrogenase-like flavoprotein